MRDVALLVLRLASGLLMAGHGAQKLFGWFGGRGPEGTKGWMESMGLKPGKFWATLAGASEFGGGLLTALGFLNPLGSVGTIGAMEMATAKVHWGKPIWVTSGGAELPVTNIAVALALGLAGPGRISVDRAIGLCLPRRLILIPGTLLAAMTVAYAVRKSAQLQQQAQQQQTAEAQQVEVTSEGVRVPETPEVHELERNDESARQDADLGSGAELQAGQAER